jgi:hypothetical protein
MSSDFDINFAMFYPVSDPAESPCE